MCTNRQTHARLQHDTEEESMQNKKYYEAEDKTSSTWKTKGSPKIDLKTGVLFKDYLTLLTKTPSHVLWPHTTDFSQSLDK